MTLEDYVFCKIVRGELPSWFFPIGSGNSQKLIWMTREKLRRVEVVKTKTAV